MKLYHQFENAWHALMGVFILCCIMAINPVGAAVTVDGAASSNTGNSVSSITIPHTTGTGTDRLMLVGVSWNCGSTNRTLSSVTFSYGAGPTVLTMSLVKTQQAGTNLRYSAIYSLLNPPSSQTGTVTVTFSGSVANGIVAGAANFQGVDQTTPLGTSNGANGSSTAASVTLTGLVGDELVFDNVFQGATDVNQTLTVGANQTGQWNGYVGNTRAAASTEQATSSSVTMSWTAASSSVWAIAAVPIKPGPIGPTHDLTMAVDPTDGGTTTPSVGSHTYAENAVVSVSATAATGYIFDHWSGDLSGSTNPTTITMDADKSVTAHYAAEEYTLTVNISGNGSVSKNPNQATYQYGDEVILTATADPGWAFAGWSGDLTWNDNPKTITITKNITITATFQAYSTVPLALDGSTPSTSADDVSSVSFSHTTGTGSDRMMLVGISWNSDTAARTIASVTFTPTGGTAVTLSEVITQKHGSKNRYSAIYRLVNPASGQTGTVTITFSGGTVTAGIVAGAANFKGVHQTTPLGTPGGAASSSDDTTPTVTLTGLAGNELMFDNLFLGGNPPAAVTPGDGQTSLWDVTVANTRGAASTEAATSASVTMSWTAASSSLWVITAVPINPVQATTTYTLIANNDGHGTVTLNPSGGTYTSGTTVTLTPVPASGYGFSSWSGANAGELVDIGGGAYTIIMNGNKTVTANFVALSKLGDVNDDNDVSSTDALIVLSCDVGIDASQHCPMNCGDVNGDGSIDSTDALVILSYDVELSVPYPVGQPGCPETVTPCSGCNP